MKHFCIRPNKVKNSTLLGIKVEIDNREFWLPKSRIIMSVDAFGNLNILIPIWICEKENL